MRYEPLGKLGNDYRMIGRPYAMAVGYTARRQKYVHYSYRFVNPWVA